MRSLLRWYVLAGAVMPASCYQPGAAAGVPAANAATQLPHELCNRRGMVTRSALALGGLGWWRTLPARAAFDERPAAVENLSKAAAKIPGYGQPDCYYPPDAFLGTWTVTREVVGVSLPQGEDAVECPQDLQEARQLASAGPIVYTARWVQRGDKVIADRSFNTRQLEEAKRPSLLQDVLWDQANPNILTLNFADGMIKETKVTKRSFEEPQPGQYGTSEYARVVLASSEGMVASVPQVSAIRTLTRYKTMPAAEDGTPTIEGLELVKYYPAVTFSTDPQAYMTIKSRLKLVRKSTPPKFT